MINVATFIVVGVLGVAWSNNSLLNFCIKITLIALALWHLFVIFETSGYIVKV